MGVSFPGNSIRINEAHGAPHSMLPLVNPTIERRCHFTRNSTEIAHSFMVSISYAKGVGARLVSGSDTLLGMGNGKDTVTAIVVKVDMTGSADGFVAELMPESEL